jgi:hypothetical protein
MYGVLAVKVVVILIIIFIRLIVWAARQGSADRQGRPTRPAEREWAPPSHMREQNHSVQEERERAWRRQQDELAQRDARQAEEGPLTVQAADEPEPNGGSPRSIDVEHAWRYSQQRWGRR